MKVFDDLEARGLVKQTTNTEKIRSLLNDGQITFYIGFDPTAESLHVGHLLQIITMRRLDDAGHSPIVVIGNATAQIGDPSSKSEGRKMLTTDVVWSNSNSIREQISKLMTHPAVRFFNNTNWSNLGFMELLREVGPHFSVNNMLRAECFKSRLESGLSFLEFSYMLLQAWDFFCLNRDKNCVLQVGGDDQWSNMLAGIDLIHKKSGREAFALTLPLLLNSDGTKMGKTEKGAVWLDEEKTSVFDFWQFWRSLPDAEVKKCFKLLTFFSVEEIEAMPFSTPAEINAAKKKLATAITEIVHGKVAAEETLEVAEALFEIHDPSLMSAIPISDGIQLLDLLVNNGFAKSRTDARNQIGNRGISINDQVVSDPLLIMTKFQLGNEFLIRKGKKKFGRFLFKESNEQT